MQSIARIPDLDIAKYSKKTSRRGNSKYEQNLEFLLAKVNEVHRKTAIVPPVLLSTSIPIRSGNVSPAMGPASALTMPVREKFFEISGGPMIVRPVSAPGPGLSGTDTPVSTSGMTTPVPMDIDSSGVSSQASMKPAPGNNKSPEKAQPRPQRTHRVALGDNDLVTTHYNLPWTDEEKRRLEELMVIFPEESVHSRRYAKIAEALGTRTASQVTNRIHKLNAKKSRQAKREAEMARDQVTKVLKNLKRSGIDLAEEEGDDLMLEEVDEEVKNSADYQEYLKLKEQLDEIKAQVIEHEGYKCDDCSMEPIVGIRYHCETCPVDYDLCQACMVLQNDIVAIRSHDPTHTIVKITTSSRKE